MMKTSQNPKKYLRWLRWLGTILSSALFIWLLTQQDWETFWTILRSLPIWLLPAAFSLYFLGILGNSVRWYILLYVINQEISYRNILQITLAGNFASNFLPSTIGGDTVRMVGAARWVGWPVSVASVVVDRLLNAVVMVCFLPAFIKVFPTLTLSFGSLNSIHTAGPGFVKAGMVTSIFSKIPRFVKNGLSGIWDALRIWRHKPVSILIGFVISFLSRISVFVGIWILAQALEMRVTFLEVISVATITYLLSLLPISINGYGLREVTMTALYVQLGATLEQASTLVFITRFILMTETLPGALWISDKLIARDGKKGFYAP